MTFENHLESAYVNMKHVFMQATTHCHDVHFLAIYHSKDFKLIIFTTFKKNLSYLGVFKDSLNFLVFSAFSIATFLFSVLLLKS